MSKVLRSLTLVACCLVFSATAYAGPVNIGFGENRNAFSLTIDGSAVTRNLMYQVIIGDSWRVTVSVTESNIAAGDLLTVAATARHISAPHGEPAGAVFSFMPGAIGAPLVSINDFSLVRMGGNQLFHVNHVDTFVITIELVGFNRQITSYTIHLEGRHCLSTLMQTCPESPQEEEIPEPATLLLLGTGIAAVGIKLRKRFKGKNSEHCSREPFS